MKNLPFFAGILSRFFVFGVIVLCLVFVSCSSGGRYKGRSSPPAAFEEEAKADYSRNYYPSKSKKLSSVSRGRIVGAAGIPAQKRMVVYRGEFTIIVKSVQDALKDAETIVDKYRGFIESAGTSDSYRYARIVLRVPVKFFQKAIGDLEKIGAVTSRKVTAADVTKEFNDTSLRMKTLQNVRARLYELLKRTKDVKEQVKILKEIERLTTQIDSMKTKIEFLKNRAAYSTLVLTLRAKVKQVVSAYLPSPFSWIRNLSPGKRSVADDYKTISYPVPEGFYHQEDEYYKNKTDWLLTTPGEKIKIRLVSVKNYPPGDLTFWKEAFLMDAGNRKYKINSHKTLKTDGGDELAVYHMKTIKNVIYSVAFNVSDDSIIIVEAVFDDEKSFRSGMPVFEKFCRGVKMQ